MAPEGADEAGSGLNLTAEEKQVYGQLFRQADSDSAGIVIGEVAVKFFEKTRLDSRTLGEIWQIADKENRGFLTPAGFSIALRLIGHAQAGREPSANLAFQPGPIPRFEGIPGAAGALPAQASLPPNTTGGGTVPLASQTTNLGASPQQLSAQGTGGAAARVPPLAIEKAAQYARLFQDQARGDSVLSGDKAKRIFEKSGLNIEILGRIWQLADTEQRGALVQTEFIIAMHLLTSTKLGTLRALPTILPAGLYEAATRGAAAAAAAPGAAVGAGAGIGAAVGGSPVARQQSPLGGNLGSGVPPLPTAGIQRQLTGQFTGQARPGAPNFAANPVSRPAPPAAVTPNTTGGGDWLITPAEKARMDPVFESLDKNKNGYITGEEAVPFLMRSGLNEDTLAQIWDLADVNSEGRLTSDTFAVALYLIQQQRQRTDGTNILPAKLPANLIPPSLRSQLRTTSPPVAQPQPQPQAPPAQAPPQPKSALQDLFGLDSDSLSTPSLPLTATATGSGAGAPTSLSDPFAGGNSPVPGSPARSPVTSSFKPFVPTSSFGRGLPGLQAQLTGDSNGSTPSSISKSGPAPAQLQTPPVSKPPFSAPATSAFTHQNDLLGGDNDEASRNLSSDTAELANLSNQIGSLSKHMQETSTHRTTLQTQLSQTSAQKKNFEERLAQLRTLYEKEARDVRALEEQLNTSRTETKKLQTELAALEASYRELQAQHQQISTALQADQQENTGLKERIKIVSAEVNQLKPQIDKLKSEARQQKGIVAINRKQLSLGEAERDKLKTEAEDLKRENEDLARQIHNASVASASSAASSGASPSVASATGKNPFFRRTGSSDIMGVFASPTQGPSSSPAAPAKPFGEKSFDDVFGPAPTATPPPAAATTASPVVASAVPPAVRPQFTGQSTGSSSFSAVTAPTSETATPGESRQAALGSDVASPSSDAGTRQIGSGFLPFGEPVTSSTTGRVTSPAPAEPHVSAAAALTSPVEHTSSTSSPTPAAAQHVSPSGPEVATGSQEATSSSTFGGLGLPAAAAAVTAATAGVAAAASSTNSASSPAADADKEKSAWGQGHAQNDSLSDPFSVLDQQQDKAKEDFESAFASFKAARANGPTSPTNGTGASGAGAATAAGAGASAKSEDAINTDATKAFASFNTEFPPISELNRDDESDSDSEGGGFDDDFAPASPKGGQGQKAVEAPPPAAPAPAPETHAENGGASSAAKAVSPPLTNAVLTGTDVFTSPTAATAPSDVFSKPPPSVDDIFSAPATTATLAQDPDKAATTVAPAPKATSDDATFDDLDDDFEGLEDAREGSADDDFANISRSGLDDFQSTFDSSPVGKLEPRTSFGVDSSFDFSNLGASAATVSAGSAAVTQNGTGSKAAADGQDWYSFIGDEQKPSAPAGSSEPSAAAASTTAAAGESRPTPPGRQLTEDSTNDDPILRQLTSMGYARSVALNALEKYDYNVDRAANYLATNES